MAVLPFKLIPASETISEIAWRHSDNKVIWHQTGARPTALRSTPALSQTRLPPGATSRLICRDGSIQRLGDRIRVSVRLIGVNDGATLWADKFDEKFTDIFAVQDSISEKVAGLLAVTLTGDDRARMVKRYTENTEAYQLYLMGRYYWNKRTQDGLKKGIEYFAQAVELDPSYALAYSGLADCSALLSNSSSFAPGEGYPKAKAAATRALATDDSLAEAPLRCLRALSIRPRCGAEQEFKRAIG
jgi:hypothetical protein